MSEHPRPPIPPQLSDVDPCVFDVEMIRDDVFNVRYMRLHFDTGNPPQCHEDLCLN